MTRSRSLRTLAGAVVVHLLGLALGFGQTTVSISPASHTLALGDEYVFTVNIAGVSNLKNSHVEIAFSIPGLEYTAATEDNAFFPIGSSWSRTTPGPAVSLVQVDQTIEGATPPLSGGGALFTVTFKAIHAGSYPLTLTAVLHDNNDAVIPVTPSGATITVPKSSTVLSASSATGPFGGTATVNATLTAGATGVNGKTVQFTLAGNSVGSATTNASGVATLPTASLSGIPAGTYPAGVGATFAEDDDYLGSTASAELVVEKASATVTLGSLTQTFDGTPKPVTATTTPPGLTVTFTYDGSETAPANAGTYAVVGTIVDANYAGSASGTLTVNKATATMAFGIVSFAFDGTPKPVSVTTTPPSLTGVTVTYGGSETPPSAIGTYALQATLNNQNYEATPINGTLTIHTYSSTTTIGSSAEPSPLGSPVTFTATVSPTAADGSVEFFDGATSLGSSTLDAGNQATVTTSALTLGTHSIMAVYAGQGDYARSESSVLTQTIVGASYTITASAGANGTIIPAGEVVVDYGASQSFTMAPATGYQVATLKVDGIGVVPATSYEFTNVTAPHTIAVTFSRSSTTITSVGTPYTFDNDGDGTTDMSVSFARLPAAGGTMTVTLLPLIPGGNPTPPADALGAYIQVSTTLPDHAFSADVKVDLFGVTGAGPTTSLACYNTVTASWVLVDGVYAASDPVFSGHPSFSFTTDHFSLFGFIGTAALPKRLYVSSAATSAAPALLVPNTDWTTTPYEENDWAWAGTHSVSVYLVPEPGSEFSGVDVTLEWDQALVSYQATSFGASGSPNGLFGDGHTYAVTRSTDQLYGTNRLTVHAARTDGNNLGPTVTGDYVARVDFNILGPGHTPIAVIGMAAQRVSPPGAVHLVPNQAETKVYLGDVASAGVPSTGDGRVDFEDLSLWSLAYWSGVTGYAGGLTNYKVKYDIGPTGNGYVFSSPVPDTRIDFEDLLIFAASYGLSSRSRLPKAVPPTEEPLLVSLGRPIAAGDEVRIPVLLEGAVADLRGLSLDVSGEFGTFRGVDKGLLTEGYTTPVLMMSRAEEGHVFLDMAIADLNVDAIHESGEVAWLRFTGQPRLHLNSVSARSSQNTPLNVAQKMGDGEGIPTAFSLDQNYPNPFNPATTIRYALPEPSRVKIEVYNILGVRVSVLMDRVQEAGFYDVRWNGRDDNGSPVASGVYLYRIHSDKFNDVKKMLLLK